MKKVLESGQLDKKNQLTEDKAQFSLTWPAALQMYWNKSVYMRRVKLQQHWFGANMAAVLLVWDVTTSYENSL